MGVGSYRARVGCQSGDRAWLTSIDSNRGARTERTLTAVEMPSPNTLRSGAPLANRPVVNIDVTTLQEIARALPECDRAAKLRALLTRVIEVQNDASALTSAADALAASATDALADDPWTAFEREARQLQSRARAAAEPTGT